MFRNLFIIFADILDIKLVEVHDTLVLFCSCCTGEYHQTAILQPLEGIRDSKITNRFVLSSIGLQILERYQDLWKRIEEKSG